MVAQSLRLWFESVVATEGDVPMLEFRRDGLMVVQESGEAGRALDANDPTSILAHLGDAVAFAPDLSAGCLMRALSPWSAALTRLTGADMRDWTSVAGGPQARAVGDDAGILDPKEGGRLAAVEVSPWLVLDIAGGVRGMRMEWRTRCAVNGGEESHCALPADPFHWSHLPFVVIDTLQVEDVSFPRGRGDAMTGLAVEPTFCDAILYGFLDEISFDETVDAAVARETGLARELAMLDLPKR